MSMRTTLAQAYGDLSTMLDAGLPIFRSLDALIEGRRGHIQRILKQIRKSVSDGSSFGEAVNEHPTVFSEMDRMLLEAAETSGSLPKALKMLAQSARLKKTGLPDLLGQLQVEFGEAQSSRLRPGATPGQAKLKAESEEGN